MLATVLATSDTRLHNVVVGLIVVAVIALFVWGAGRVVGRPDIGNIGAAIVAVIGALLVLLDYA